MSPPEKVKRLISKAMQNTSTYLAIGAGLILVAMMFIVIYEVWMRFVANQPVAWSIEVPMLLFLVIVFLGLPYTTRVGGHISVEILTLRLSQRTKALLGTITSFVALGVSAILLWKLAGVFWLCFVEKWYTSTTVLVIMWPFYTTLVVGGFLMSLEWIAKIVANWRDFKRAGK